MMDRQPPNRRHHPQHPRPGHHPYPQPPASPSNRMPVPYRPAHPSYIPATPSSSHIQTHTSMHTGTGGGQVHVHHHHHTYHHNHPPQHSPSSPHAQPFPGQPRPTRPYYHPAMPPVPGRPAFGYVYPPRPFIAPMPVPMGAAFGGPFFFPFPGQSFSWDGRPEEGGQEAQEGEESTEDRERAFPPSCPRLFNGVHVPPQAYPRGTRAGFRGTRPAHRGRDDPKARPRGGFEVHHPDGTVEYEEEEGPRVEEMPLEGEDAWETARARHRQERQGTVGGEDGEVGSGKEMQEEQLMIGWDGATALPPPSSPIVLAMQDPRLISSARPEQTPASTTSQNVPHTGSGSEWQLVSPQPSPSLATSPGAGEAVPSLQTPTTMTSTFQLSPGTQAPKGTPEGSPVLGVFPDTKLPGRGGSRGKDDQARKMREDASDTLEDPDKGNHLPTGGKLSSRSLPVRLELAARDSTGPPPIIDKDKRKEPKHQDTPIVQSEGITPTLTMVADKRNPTAPLSASLPSPEPAQVLDRLLEVTGLSARQFMIMLERGDFKVEDAAQGRAA